MSIKKKFLVDIDLDNNQINNVAAPQVSGDVATYEWVTGLISTEKDARGASFSTVDGKIKDIISNLDITAVDSFTEVVTKINADINAEATARIADVNAEETRALAAEALIQADIDAEVSRIDSRDLATEVRIYNLEGVVSAETANRISDVNAEETRAIAAEGVLQTNISAEAASRIAGDSAEALLARAAEAGLQADVDAVTANVDAILLASDADKDSFAEIVALINSVDTENNDTFAGYVSSNNAAVAAEEAARIAADSAITSAYTAADSAESVARIAGDSDLTAAYIAGDSDLTAAYIAADSAITSAYTAADSAESVARIAGDSDLTDAYMAADNILQTNIDALDGAAIKTASNGLTEIDNNVKLGGALLSGDTVFTGAAGNVEVKFGNNGGEISRFWIKATGEIYNVTEYGVITTSSEWNNINTTATRGNINTTATAGAITDSSVSMGITTTGGLGAVYGADYSAGFVNNSLVSKLYVTNQIAAEALLARAAEAGLQADVDAVTANVDAILLASDADKDSFAEIVTLINSVDTANDSAFAGYVSSNNAALSAEIANRAADVDAEETRAIAAEGVLTSNLDSAKTIIADRMNITPVVSSFTIGNGLTHSFVLEHSLGTTDVIIQVYNVATGQTVETSAIRVDDQNISIEFASVPALNSYKVVTMGVQAFTFFRAGY